jgi:hypothetical protein
MNFSPLKISQLGNAIRNTALRFPLIITLMGVAVCFALLNLWSITENESNPSLEGFRWAIILGAGLPLYVGYFIWYAHQSFGSRLSNGALLGLTVLIHFYVGQHIFHLNAETANDNEPFWIISWLIIIHLYPSLLPFFKGRSLKDFWTYNHWMFSNFIASTFYILLIYAGIELALGGIQLLLFEDLSWKLHVTFLILLIGIFHPIFFLSSAPTSETNEIESGNLSALQRIQQWILSPLVVIYLGILYVYFFKILFQQSLPKGWVSIWILLFSIIGLLNWLLARPFVSKDNGPWGVTSRRFFLYLFPLICLLWYAIVYRLLEYGMTETRLIVVFLAIFLSVVAVIFYIRPQTNILIIPAILLFITLAYINGGPLSANALSFHSQMKEWEKIKAQPENYTYDHTSDVLSYLSNHHSDKAIQFCLNCDSLRLSDVDDYNWANEQIQQSNWEFLPDTTTFAENEFTQLYIQNDGPVQVSGYSEIISISRNDRYVENEFSNGFTALLIADVVSNPQNQNETLQIAMRNPSGQQASFFFGQLLQDIISKWEKSQQPSNRDIQGKIVFDFSFEGKTFRFISDYINYETTTLRVDAISGHLLMK